jgi:tRNA pseudouridine32 synthase/23S rRNA pseudouridine746 synthase
MAIMKRSDKALMFFVYTGVGLSSQVRSASALIGTLLSTKNRINSNNGLLHMSSKVFNPETKRYIKQTSTSNKTSRWYEIMHKTGGFISYHGALTPIDLDALVKRGTSKPIYARNVPEEVVDDDWFEVEPDTVTPTVSDDGIEYPQHDQILFVQKPHSLLTLPGIGSEKADCVASRVNRWLEDSSDGNRKINVATESIRLNPIPKKKKKHKKQFIPRPCHRLDFDTSGVLVIGLTRESHRSMSSLFEKRLLQKKYVALVYGHVKDDEGSITAPIGKIFDSVEKFNKFACLGGHNRESDFIESSLREAKTVYKVVNRFTIPCSSGEDEAKYSRVELIPYSGRGHQLRLHMNEIGHPILGDTLHGPEHVAQSTPRLCLHAESLELNVTVGKKRIERVQAKSLSPF